MPINKYWEFVCDNCNAPIFYSIEDMQTAIHKAKENGIIIKGGKKVFCDKKKCLKEWRKKNGK